MLKSSGPIIYLKKGKKEGLVGLDPRKKTISTESQFLVWYLLAFDNLKRFEQPHKEILYVYRTILCSPFSFIKQALKLKTILRGDAPTSLISSGALLKHQPWEPQCFTSDFPYEIICGDSWGDKLIIATQAGTYVLEGNPSETILAFKKTVFSKFRSGMVGELKV